MTVAIGLLNRLSLRNIRVFTGTGTITMLNEGVLEVKKAVGAATAVTLPATPSAGDCVFIKDAKGDAGTNNITITPASGTVDGAATCVINWNYGSLVLGYNGTEWGVMASKELTSSLTRAANGLYPTSIPLLSARNVNGGALATIPAEAVFGYTIILGTSEALISKTANNTSINGAAAFEFAMPSTYVAGSNFNVTIHASISTGGSPTFTARGVQAKGYRTLSNGVQGADMGPGATSNVTAAGADMIFPMNGAALSPGDRVLFVATGILTETGSVAANLNINSVRLS